MTTEQYDKIITSLSSLETNMESLVGNGQPGRIAQIENKLFWVIVYGVGLTVLILGPAAFALLK
jgi:hypothetical protein